MTITDVTTQPTDTERFNHILQTQRAAYLRDGAPSLEARRSDLTRFKTALIARRGDIEDAINADFGHRSRHESALMEVLGVVQGIDYLRRNLRRFMRRPAATSSCRCVSAATASSTSRSALSASSHRGTIRSTCRSCPSSPRSPPATASCSSRRS
ncbi:hypothetical protein [Streptomyces stelliscabiei]|uniref:hypothetical protein n=1 Tax=Streptomyces stelliscabiei TaxID=146820 RepID=UPI002FF14F9D